MVKDAKTFQDGMMETATNTIAIGTRTAGRDVYLYDPEQCQDETASQAPVIARSSLVCMINRL